jgi:CRP/FNR family transcriptional regulator, nitrogen oxide reductase regulator
MLADKISDIVASSAILMNLTPVEVQTFMAEGRQRSANKDTFLFQQGDLASSFYIITQGRIRLVQLAVDGNQVTLNYFGPGDGIGVIVALREMPYPASAEVLEDTIVLSWDRETIHKLMLQIPQLAINGMEMIAKRFSRLQGLYLEMATQRVEQRIALTLLRLVRQFGKRVDIGVLIDMPLSRQELADMTGTNLYNVSRILRKWEQAGIVSIGRKQVILCKAHELVILTEGPSS